MELLPSQVRKIILDEHFIIRRIFAELDTLVQTAETDLAGTPISALLDKISEFTGFFLKHIALEERILRPALKNIDAWGDVRVDQMDQEHQEQRAEIAALSARLEKGLTPELVKDIRAFINEIRQDVSSEERDCLNPDVLKDDIISVDTSCG